MYSCPIPTPIDTFAHLETKASFISWQLISVHTQHHRTLYHNPSLLKYVPSSLSIRRVATNFQTVYAVRDGFFLFFLKIFKSPRNDFCHCRWLVQVRRRAALMRTASRLRSRGHRHGAYIVAPSMGTTCYLWSYPRAYGKVPSQSVPLPPPPQHS